MAEPLFQVQGVTKTYRTGDVEVQALRGIDLDLFAGELAVMLGPSGSGKSTLLNILGGLDTATAGSVRFRGRELTRFSDRELTLYRRNHVGFIFQFYNLIPSLTARENVALVSEIAPHPMKPEEALELVGLEQPPGPFSGAAFRRRAAARRHRPRRRQAAGDHAVRRADRRARFQDRHPGAGGAGRDQPRARHHHRDHHPQRLDRPDRRPRVPLHRRPDRRGRRPTNAGSMPREIAW